MDQKMHEAILFVHSYAFQVSDWKVLKKELLKVLPPDKRKLFSTRDQKTKKQFLNSLEKEIIEEWKKITGKSLYLDTP